MVTLLALPQYSFRSYTIWTTQKIIYIHKKNTQRKSWKRLQSFLQDLSAEMESLVKILVLVTDFFAVPNILWKTMYTYIHTNTHTHILSSLQYFLAPIHRVNWIWMNRISNVSTKLLYNSSCYKWESESHIKSFGPWQSKNNSHNYRCVNYHCTITIGIIYQVPHSRKLCKMVKLLYKSN